MTHQQILVDQAESLCDCLFFLTLSQVDSLPISDLERLNRVRQRAYARYFRRFSVLSSNLAAVEREALQQPEEHFLEPAGYTVVHVEADPDACPECFGTGLDFTHHADHCLSCLITYQPKSGDSARLPAGASGAAVGQGGINA